MRNKVNLIFENITITAVAAEGKALAKVNDMVLFVAFAAPGDVVDVEVFRKKKSFMEGRIVKFHTYSPLRETPFCEHFGVCGGCKWQHLVYSEQLIQKQQQVCDHLERIGKLKLPTVQAILGSTHTQYYRNKLEYTFAPKRWLSMAEIAADTELSAEDRAGLGFHLPGMFDKVLDITHCYLQASPSNEIRLAIKAFVLEQGYSFYDVRENRGFLRNMIIRNTTTLEFMLILIVSEDDEEKIKNILDFVSAKFPQITSLQYVINAKLNDSITDLEVVLYKGTPYITETMPTYTKNGEPATSSLLFRIGPKSFYQTNSEQAYKLYSLALDFADLQGNEIVYDLYTGTGTIANFIAPHVQKVIGIEYVPQAIEDAFENAKINGIYNTVFYAGDMAKVLTPDFVKRNSKPNLVITDPPRDGMHASVVEQLIKMCPEKIVYISCNSATQARDLALLCQDGLYAIDKLRAVDMFPHTHHVESVVSLKRV
ncbi:MAG: 23S rRNA (uracil(1939)-C(5))-methyltransferase RlmD [Bacteroidales bacterium]